MCQTPKKENYSASCFFWTSKVFNLGALNCWIQGGGKYFCCCCCCCFNTKAIRLVFIAIISTEHTGRSEATSAGSACHLLCPLKSAADKASQINTLMCETVTTNKKEQDKMKWSEPYLASCTPFLFKTTPAKNKVSKLREKFSSWANTGLGLLFERREGKSVLSSVALWGGYHMTRHPSHAPGNCRHKTCPGSSGDTGGECLLVTGAFPRKVSQKTHFFCRNHTNFWVISQSLRLYIPGHVVEFVVLFTRRDEQIETLHQITAGWKPCCMNPDKTMVLNTTMPAQLTSCWDWYRS